MLKYFTLLTAACFVIVTYGQQLPVDSGSLLKVKKKALSAVEDLGDQLPTKAKGLYQPLLSKVDTSARKISFNGSIVMEGEHISNSNFPPGANGFYYRAGVNGGVKIGKLPFNAGFTLNFRNNKLWTDYTLMNFSFDSRGFMNTVKDSYLDYLSDMSNFYPKELSDQVLSYQDSMSKFSDLRNTLNSSSYYDKLKSFKTDYNILRDSLMKSNMDSCAYEDYERISDSINHYKGMAKQYADLEKYRSQNLDLQKYLNTYNQYVDSVKNTADILSIDGVKEQLTKAGILNKKSLAFTGIEKLGIGRINLDLSEFTSRSQSIFGVNFDYYIKNLVYAGVGLGFASPNNFQFNPSFNSFRNTQQFNVKRIIGYLRLGLGKPDKDHIHLIYLAYGDKFGATDSLAGFSAAPANAVLALEGKKSITKTVSVEGEVATSNASYINRTATFSPIETGTKKPQLNYALRMQLNATITKTATTLAVRGRAVSNLFTSAGNLFQRRDFAEYGVTLAQPLFKGRLTLNTVYNHNLLGVFTGVNQSSVINLTNIATVSAAAFARYTLSHTYLKQLVPGQAKAGFNSQMVSLTQLYTYGDAKAKGITNITFNYTQSKFGTAEKPVKNNTYQGGLQQSIVLPKGFAPMLGAGVTVTQTNLNLLSLMYWVEAGSRVTIKEKAFLNFNFKYLRDNLGNSNYYTTLNITATLYKGLQFKVSEQLQAIDAGRWFINSQAMAGISYNFAYTLKKPLSFRFKKQVKTAGK